MAYADTYAAVSDPIFCGRCMVAMWVAAQAIISEDPGAADHQRRYDWAVSVLRDQVSISPRLLAMQVLRNATIAANPTAAVDGDLQFQVNSIIADLITLG